MGLGVGVQSGLWVHGCSWHSQHTVPTLIWMLHFYEGTCCGWQLLLTALSLAVCKAVRGCARSLHLPEVQGAVWGSV